MRKTVTLDIAFCWYCPECGARNFCRGYAPEFDSVVSIGLMSRVGAAADDLRHSPANVKCYGCGVRFKTEM